jgi:hypothetical protein
MKTVNQWTEISMKKGGNQPTQETVIVVSQAKEEVNTHIEEEVFPSIKLLRPTKQVLMMDRLGSVRMVWCCREIISSITIIDGKSVRARRSIRPFN